MKISSLALTGAFLLAGAAGVMPSMVAHAASAKPEHHGKAPLKSGLNMTATAYGPSLQDNYPYGPVDAFGRPLVSGDVAVDPKLIPLGTKLYISGYHSPYLPAKGFYAVARDTGNAIQGNRIDIFVNGSPNEVATFGIQHVRVTILNSLAQNVPSTGLTPAGQDSHAGH
jgi:3D (Asp-Asp-Asp) domain-containing protein